MITYKYRDLVNALANTGLGEGDLVYFSSRLHSIGALEGATSRQQFLDLIYGSIRHVIGPSGTLVVPTFTQQVGEFGLPYHHEKTPCRTGLLGEYVRHMDGALRSLHPVYSVSAIGPKARDVCEDISSVAFGADSAFDRIIQLEGKTTCVGFPKKRGHAVSLAHCVEAKVGVPYKYVKAVLADCYKGGVQIKRQYYMYSRYLYFDVAHNWSRYVESLDASGCLYQSQVGDSTVYTTEAPTQYDHGVALLKNDIHAFLAHPPKYVPGRIPMDGPPCAGKQADSKRNWVGCDIQCI